MNKRNYELTLNVTTGKIKIPSISIYNTDKGIFNIKLFLEKGEGKNIVKLTHDEIVNYKALFQAVKSKTKNYVELEGILDETENFFYYDLGSKFNDQVGVYNCQMFITDTNGTDDSTTDDEVVTSVPFNYTVMASILTGLNSEIKANPDLPVLKKLINECKILMNLDSADMSVLDPFQTKVDNTLTTTEKEIPKAINEVSSQIKENENKFNEQINTVVNQSNYNKNNISVFWTPDKQLPARNDIPGYDIDGFNWVAMDFINNLWKPLQAQFPNYITEEIVGKDSSNTYDIYKYVFTPINYKKTIFIVANVHGGEVMGQIGLYRFLYELCNNYKSHKSLEYIRHNVRLVVLPLMNPWGCSQKPRQYCNSNGVSIYLNYDYRWGEWDPGQKGEAPFGQWYQGTSPFSESETRIIRDEFNKYNDIVSYLDLHNFGYAKRENTEFGMFVYEKPTNGIKYTSAYDDMFNFFKSKYDDTLVNILTRPTSTSSVNYFTNLGTPSECIEYIDGSSKDIQYSSNEVTLATEYFGNVIIANALYREKNNFLVKEFYFTRGTQSILLPVDSTTPQLITQLERTINVPQNGIMLVDVMCTIKNSDKTSVNFFTPYIYQDLRTDLPSVADTTRYEVFSSATSEDYSTITMNISQPIVGISAGNRSVTVGLKARTKIGNAEIYRYRMRVTFIPTTNLFRYESVEILSDGTQTVMYPIL